MVRVHWGCEGDQRQLQLHPLQEPPHLFLFFTFGFSTLLQIQSQHHVGRQASQSVAPGPPGGTVGVEISAEF